MKKVVLILLYAGLLLFVFLGIPDTIMYRQHGFWVWFPFVLIFGIQAILVYAIARAFAINSYRSKGVAALAILITGPLFGIYCVKKQDRELLKNGRVALGVVYKKWESRGNNGHQWLLRCNFEVNGINYSTFTEEDKNNIYHPGDTLHILYSKDVPTNCLIIELENRMGAPIKQ